MNCNIFKKGLEDYVLGNTSDDLKIALEKHMDECESCRRLYEEEIKIDRDFKMVLSIDGIEFNSSRASIINSIDKNRYSKKTSNKILYNFKRYKNRYLSYAVAAVAMIVFIPMMLKGFAGGNYKSVTENKPKTMVESSEKDNTNSNAKMGVASSESSKVMDKAIVANGPLEFKSTIITKQALPAYEMNWKNSGDGKSSAAIDISPEKDVDFGIHAVYIKNIGTNEMVKYEVINNEAQYTPRNIQWWDNEHLIIVTGLGYGTINHGSDVYSLDINTGIFSALYHVKDQKYQILEVTKVKNDLILQLLIYEDDTYNAFHNGVGKMTLLEADKPVDMIIEGEEKK